MNSGERTVVAVHGPDDRPQPDIVVDVACDDAQNLQLKPAHAYDDRHERQGKNGAGGEAVDADVSRHLKCNRTGLGRFGAEALIGQPINSLQLVIDPASQLEGGLAVVGMLSPRRVRSSGGCHSVQGRLGGTVNATQLRTDPPFFTSFTEGARRVTFSNVLTAA